MFGTISKEYEILCYEDENRVQGPVLRDTSTNRNEALRQAKKRSEEYPLIEANVLLYENGDPVGDEVLCVYRNGVRTA